jgi:mRNA interferase YafQ
MFEIVTSTKFLKDLKLLKKRSVKDLQLLQQVITTLAEKGHSGLSKKHNAHKLSGDYRLLGMPRETRSAAYLGRK